MSHENRVVRMIGGGITQQAMRQCRAGPASLWINLWIMWIKGKGWQSRIDHPIMYMQGPSEI